MAIGTPASIGTVATFGASGNTALLVLTAAVSVGDKVIVGCGQNTLGGSVSTITDTRSNTWRKDGTIPSEFQVATYQIVSCDVTTAMQIGDTITITFLASSTNRLAAGVSVSGLATGAGSLDKINGSEGVVAAWDSLAVATTTQADELAFGGVLANCGSYTSSAPGAPNTEVTGHDFKTSDEVGLANVYQILSATGTPKANGTLTATSIVWAAGVATYMGAAGPPPPPAAEVLRVMRSNMRTGGV